MSELAEFSNLARALAPWRAKIVFIGGWAFRLYSYEPRAWKSDHKPIFTQDADVAYAERERLEGDIKKALEGAGFKEEPSLAGGASRLRCATPWARRPTGFTRNFSRR